MIFDKGFFCQLQDRITELKAKGPTNLYNHLIDRLDLFNVPERCHRTTVDLYDTIRTIVMTSGDNAITSWIQYHWSLLRLARSTLFPAFLLIILVPRIALEWNLTTIQVVAALLFCILFFCFQFIHYYYREKFMIYSMIGYFFTLSDKRANSLGTSSGNN